MKGHCDRTSIFNADCPFRLSRWVCIFKENSLKRISLEINFFTIYFDNVKVKHSSIACYFVKLTCLVVTGENEVFGKVSLLIRIKSNVNINCVSRVKVKFTGSYCE